MTKRWLNLTQHWLWMIPLLLLISGLATRQIDRFPISIDELLSINNAGYIGDDTSVSNILENIRIYSSQHVPAYFLLVGTASKFIGWSPPALRMIGIWLGLLALAWTYRLGRDHHSGAAGLYAAVFMSGLTLYSFYYAHIRMYTMLTLATAFLLWIYLRLIEPNRHVRSYEWVMLSLGTLFFLSTHIFSITLMVAIGIYHLLVVPKNRRWLQVSGAIILGGLPLIFWLPVLLDGFLYAADLDIFTTHALTPPEIVVNMLIVYGNSIIPLLLVGLIVIVYLSWNQKKELRVWLIWCGITTLIVLLIGGASSIITSNQLRYTFVMLVPLAVAIGIGLAHFRYHVLIAGVLCVVWVGTDIWMQRTFDMTEYLGGLMNIYNMPRLDEYAPSIASATDSDTLILSFSKHRDLTLPVLHGNTIQDFYYHNVNRQHYSLFLDQEELKSDDEIQSSLSDALEGWTKLALVTENRHTPSQRIREIYDDVLAERFQACEMMALSDNLMLTSYILIDNDCTAN